MNQKNQINIHSFSVISIFFFFFLFPSNLTLRNLLPSLSFIFRVFLYSFTLFSPFTLLPFFLLPSLSINSYSFFVSYFSFVFSHSLYSFFLFFLTFSLFFFLVYYSYAFLPYTFSSHSSLSIFSSPTPYHSKPPLMSSPFLHSPSPTISLTLSPPHTHYQHIHALLPHSTPPFSLELSTFFSCVGLIFFSGSCQAISD